MASEPTRPEIEERVQLLYAEWFPTRTVSLADSEWLRDILLPAARKQLIREAKMQAAMAVGQVNARTSCHV